jgi:hypothetical protein
MNTTGYAINAVLVLLVVKQIRGRRLDFQNLVLPVVLVAAAAAYYLHAVPTAGNDLVLELGLALVGATLGSLCGLSTILERDGDGAMVARAGAAAAALWVVGTGARMLFAYSSDHGAGPAIAHLSRAASITGAEAWTAALVLMALAEVIARLVVVRVRARRANPGAAPADRRALALS